MQELLYTMELFWTDLTLSYFHDTATFHSNKEVGGETVDDRSLRMFTISKNSWCVCDDGKQPTVWIVSFIS